MSHKPGRMALVLILVATAVNISILIFNLSVPSRAAVAGMDYQALMSDSISSRRYNQSCKRAVST